MMSRVMVNKQLWLQEKVNSGEIQVMKVKGEGYLADGLTQPLEGTGVKKHIGLTGQEVIEGRHELTPDFEAAVEKKGQIETYDVEENDLNHDVLQFPSGSDVLELLCLTTENESNRFEQFDGSLRRA